MEIDPAKDLEIAAHVLTIAKTHKIDAREALRLYIEKLKLEAEQEKQKSTNLSDYLKERLSPEKWESLMSYVRHHPTDEELTQAYYQAKRQGRLKPAKLLVGGDFYFRNSDFVGKKYLEPGIVLEAELYDNTICHIWLSPIECEFVFPDELEFI
ncbi:hypothetical protein [Aulosira sp. FACHB-615]|uniref:hypothetical protein n=1 Tax=Aulosira sp. FACHB-615 TaxID=2692777 RepID=UPI00168930DC|nr:hypothetical protein [Aulosira sp. FACHB-615]MBD2492673.1 hypothetical protein [Aulosira sp. FACHB-615]